jgi:hypothetical protein
VAQIRELIAQEHLAVDQQSPLLYMLQRLCSAAVRDLGVSGCWVRLMTEPEPSGVGAASDPISQTLEELQFTLGEGPCIDAFSSRRPILDGDLEAVDGGRWPVYGPAALTRGARAVFAFPLQVGAVRLGVMGLYADRPGGLTAATIVRALAFADVATDAVLDAQALAEQGAAPPGVDEAMDNRAELYQAQGMVMIQLGISLVDAMVRLRAHAYSHDRRLGEVAHDVVVARLRLDDVL